MYCQFNSYFSFVIMEKLYFSLICTFCCCLVKEGIVGRLGEGGGGGQLFGRSLSGGKLPRRQLSGEPIVLGSNCPGGNYLGGITIFPF